MRAWVDVDLDALAANYETLVRRANPRRGVLPVVKTDAYGLGVGPVLRLFEGMEPWGYTVATLVEGIQLREEGIQRPILSLFCTPQELELAVEARLSPAIGDLEALARWRAIADAAGRELPFHLEIDTGMGRLGFACDRVDEWLPQVLGSCDDGDLVWEGTFTHFHSADHENGAATQEQWDRFQACLGCFPEGAGGAVHVAASAAAARWPEYAADLIRPGLFLFGGGELGDLEPEPVVTVRARVLSVRDVAEGWTASYGATYRAEEPSRWATVAIGYGDGLRRELSNRGAMRTAYGLAPIIGRVCMDVTILDVSDLNGVEAGDEVTVLGGPYRGPTGLGTVSERCGTIPYEILTGLGSRLPRRYRSARVASDDADAAVSGQGDARGGSTAS